MESMRLGDREAIEQSERRSSALPGADQQHLSNEHTHTHLPKPEYSTPEHTTSTASRGVVGTL
jgi:hypothetical protein